MLSMQQAKEYFIRYDGHFFHMGREEPSLYDEFKNMRIDSNTMEIWRQEILDNFYQLFLSGKKKDECWFIVSHFLSVVKETDTKHDDNGRKLLEMLNYAAAELDKQQKILITEIMVEHGVRWFCQNTMLKDEMLSEINNLIDFNVEFTPAKIGYDNAYERYNEALKSLNEAINGYAKK